MRLELRHFRVITALADELSFKQAARCLGLPQPALSSQLARIEKTLGVTLFYRTTRSVSQTPAGTELLPLARAVESAVLEFEEGVRALRSGRTREVRLAVGPGLLGSVVDRLPAGHTDLRIVHVLADGDHALAAVRDGTADVGHGHDYPTDPISVPADLRLSAIAEEPLLVGMSVTHPLAGASQVPLSDLASATWVSGDAGSRHHEHLVGLARSAGFAPDVRYTTWSSAAVGDLLRLGRCVGLVTATSPIPPGVVTRPLVPTSVRRSVVMWSPTRCPSSVVGALRCALDGRGQPPRMHIVPRATA